jgi:hypothetical protein
MHIFLQKSNKCDELNQKGETLRLLPRCIKFVYYITIVSAFCANMIVVSQTTTLSVLGAGLALRGPDGSMMTATDGLYEERTSVFLIFGIGMACTVGSVVLSVWLILHWEAALCCMIITLLTGRIIWRNYLRIQKRFDFDESETVDFSDIMNGPAAIRAVPWNVGRRRKNGHEESSASSSRRGKNIKKGSSLPLEIDEGTDDSDTSWQQQSQKLLRDQEVKQRRQKSPESQKVHIQTI